MKDDEPASRMDARSFRATLLAAGAMALLPFARMLAKGEPLYFRDLSSQFFPARLWILDALHNGTIPWWNPLVHDGEPVGFAPIGYLFDLFQLLRPDEFGLSISLVLHVAFAAMAFVALARELDLGVEGAFAGACIYALGGFALSSVNLYVFVQGIAWSPLLALALRRTIRRGGLTDVMLCGLVCGVLLSTGALEIALQAGLMAAALTPPRSTHAFVRATVAALLGIGLSAYALFPLLSAARSGARGDGFSADMVLHFSVHPVSLFQSAIANLHGDTANLTGLWWGERFFPNGFPYILSLYVGATALALALVGTKSRRGHTTRVALLAAFALIVALGAYVGWGAIVELSSRFRFLRHPVKAYFVVHYAVALLAAQAIDDVRQDPAHGRRVAMSCSLVGALLASVAAVAWLLPEAAVGVVPVSYWPELSGALQRNTIVRLVGAEGVLGGILCLGVGALLFLAAAGRVAPRRAAAGAALVVAADVLRAGAGLNPSVTRDFYAASPEMLRTADDVRATGGRLFTCDVESSSSFWQGRAMRGTNHESFSMAAMQETFTPMSNLRLRVPTSLSPDSTGLVEKARVLDTALAGCGDPSAILASLRTAGITRVVSLDPLLVDGLTLERVEAPRRLAPARLYIYAVAEAATRFTPAVSIVLETTDELRLRVENPATGPLIVRDTFAPGWTAEVNDRPATIERTAAGHRSVALPAGSNEVVFRYHPPGARVGFLVSILTALAGAAALLRAHGRRHASTQSAASN
jgi:hypothetical protein